MTHFQAEVLSETLEFFDTQSVVTLINVEVVMVLPESTLLSRAFCGQGSLVGIVVNMWKMEIGEVYQTGIDVGLLDFEGRTTGPVLTAGSLKVAEIGYGDRGVQGAEDIPIPVCRGCGRCGVGGRGAGRG